MTDKHKDALILELQARVAHAGRVIESFRDAAEAGVAPPEQTLDQANSILVSLELEDLNSRRENSPIWMEAKALADWVRDKDSVVPAGNPTNEHVLWNALMLVYSAIDNPFISNRYKEAQKAFKQSMDYIRGRSKVTPD
ncbi:hypothetical protein HNP46_004206 [Pseudomonas nitritireducens]|uniref:Uncharacterized protein n=1 Tax=Pseudomonas nitroreducens TaxID=46680 RepID=A0A7W7P392_PSENT|nr:hypothetical protein [Pseudomonas nitritireducens]MBB4865325.1 hypothetical protein [Pseudomonas nitritireducens]